MIWNAVRPVAQQALDSFVAMRAAEGERLKDDLLGKLGEIGERVTLIEARSPETCLLYTSRCV